MSKRDAANEIRTSLLSFVPVAHTAIQGLSEGTSHLKIGGRLAKLTLPCSGPTLGCFIVVTKQDVFRLSSFCGFNFVAWSKYKIRCRSAVGLASLKTASSLRNEPRCFVTLQ